MRDTRPVARQRPRIPGIMSVFSGSRHKRHKTG
jgi:hypothetical protein